MSAVEISECLRDIPCVDCDDTRCWFYGKKEADCPKYRCDRPQEFQYVCDRCGFIDKFIEDMRNRRHSDAL